MDIFLVGAGCPHATRLRSGGGTCPHGRPLACFRRHSPDDPCLGTPLCPDCYDYPAHVVWNAGAGELWRRTKQDIERHLVQLATNRGIPWPDEDLPPVRLAEGVPISEVSRWLGHKSITTTVNLYGHLVPEASGRARDALDRAFAGARMCPESAPAAS